MNLTVQSQVSGIISLRLNDLHIMQSPVLVHVYMMFFNWCCLNSVVHFFSVPPFSR